MNKVTCNYGRLFLPQSKKWNKINKTGNCDTNFKIRNSHIVRYEVTVERSHGYKKCI